MLIYRNLAVCQKRGACSDQVLHQGSHLPSRTVFTYGKFSESVTSNTLWHGWHIIFKNPRVRPYDGLGGRIVSHLAI